MSDEDVEVGQEGGFDGVGVSADERENLGIGKMFSQSTEDLLNEMDAEAPETDAPEGVEGEAPEGQDDGGKAEPLKAPQSFTAEEKADFDKMPDEAKRAVLRVEAARQAGFTQKMQELSGKAKGEETQATPEPEVPEDIPEIVRTFSEYTQAVLAANDDDAAEVLLSNPKGLKALMSAVMAIPQLIAVVKNDFSPLLEERAALTQQQEARAELESWVNGMPESDRSDEVLLKINEYVRRDAEKYADQPPRARFELAYKEYLLDRKVSEAQQFGEKRGVQKAKAKSLVGLPATGSGKGRTPSEDDEIFEQWERSPSGNPFSNR